MSDAPELETLFDPIRQAMQDMEARALRFEYIAATIRVNATRHGATNDQIEDFIAGRADFIGWLAEKVERPTPDPRLTALVEAAEYILDGMGIDGPDYAIDPDDEFLDAANSKWVRGVLTRLAAALRPQK